MLRTKKFLHGLWRIVTEIHTISWLVGLIAASAYGAWAVIESTWSPIKVAVSALLLAVLALAVSALMLIRSRPQITYPSIQLEKSPAIGGAILGGAGLIAVATVVGAAMIGPTPAVERARREPFVPAPRFEVVQIRVPDFLLQCAPEPAPPPKEPRPTNFEFATWVEDVRMAADDCRRKIDEIKKLMSVD
jgi:hypothetical protein